MNFIYKINKNLEEKVSISPRYKVVLEIIKNIPKNSIGIEIGVWDASLSCFILDNKPEISKLYLLDPWKKYQPEEYIDSLNNCSQEHYDYIYNGVRSNINKYRDRVKILKGTSVNFKDRFENNSLDFIYIDANHMYDAVYSDISNWHPKLKIGGLLIGNDFIEDGYYVWTKDSHGNPTCFGEYGVKSAVRVFCKQNNIEHHTPGQNQWYIIKN